MKIWVDADACPVMIKEILFRIADQRKIETTFVANKYMRMPKSKFIHMILVESGFDRADMEIVKLLQKGDIVITGDIPLASDSIDKGADVLNHRGREYTKENIRELLGTRDFMETMRASGMETGGPPPFTMKDRNNFVNSLDRLIVKNLKGKSS